MKLIAIYPGIKLIDFGFQFHEEKRSFGLYHLKNKCFIDLSGAPFYFSFQDFLNSLQSKEITLTELCRYDCSYSVSLICSKVKEWQEKVN